MYQITFNGFLQKITRVFKTKKSCVLWLRQIGKPELITKIEKI